MDLARTIPSIGPGGPLTLDEYQTLVSAGDVDTVVCAVPDPYGRMMGKRLTTRAFEALCLGGEGLHASLYLFATDIEMEPMDLAIADAQNGYPDFCMRPDLDTLRRIPWEPNAVLVLCDAYEVDTDSLIPIAPRTVLKRQIARAAALDLEFKFASELEFYLAKKLDAGLQREQIESMPMTSRRRMDYNLLQSARDEWFIRPLRNGLDLLGIPVEASKSEWGLGQHEITLEYAPVLEMADRHTMFKYAVKQLADACGMTASFMAKPGIDEVGSSCHIHASLWSHSTGEPIGCDEQAPGFMTRPFGQFVAGQMLSAQELALMWAPTVNSYKRFLPNSFAGTALVVGMDNRSCAFRLVGKGRSFRVENRIPGADANPYHAFAAILAGGLRGIEENLPIPTLYCGNAYEDPALECMTTTMHASVARFRGSEFARKSFGDDVHQHIADFATVELARFEHGAVTDWETQRYFGRI